MLAVVEGAQRSGKTCWCVVNVICKTLIESDKRHIYTNLPLNIDALIDYCCKEIGKKADPVSMRDRLTVETNPEILKEFWHYAKPNSVIVLDELYEIFAARHWKDRSDELLSYTRQHGHYQDDLYLVSHDIRDLDSVIRRGAQCVYQVENSKYKNMFQHSLLRGIKWPVQFFVIVRLYKGQKESEADVFYLKPKKIHFTLYNSRSASVMLKGKELPGDDAESEDLNKSYWKILRDNAQQFVFAFMVIAAVAGAAYGFIFVGLPAMGEFGKQSASVGSKTSDDVKKESNRGSVVESSESSSVVSSVDSGLGRCYLRSELAQYYDNATFDKGRGYKGVIVEELKESCIIFSDRQSGLKFALVCPSWSVVSAARSRQD